VPKGGDGLVEALRALLAETRPTAVFNAAAYNQVDVAEREGLWLHVDAAYGGAARLSPRDATRVGDLERPAVDLGADDVDRREARSLIDEVRQEHGRAQARLAGVAFYEERIARLEQVGNGERRSGAS